MFMLNFYKFLLFFSFSAHSLLFSADFVPMQVDFGSRIDENKAKLLRIAWCVMRIARANLQNKANLPQKG